MGKRFQHPFVGPASVLEIYEIKEFLSDRSMKKCEMITYQADEGKQVKIVENVLSALCHVTDSQSIH